MAGDPGTDLEDLFDKAANFLKNIAGKLDSDRLLYFYARFKQTKEGSCNTSKPGFFDFQGKQKWEAWKQLGQKNKQDAMQEYVNELTRLEPDWLEKCDTSTQQSGSAFGGVVVSTMPNPDSDLKDEEKTIFDWCKEGDLEKLTKSLKKEGADINVKDGEGMCLLHWSCDRGNEEIVKYLLKQKANLNELDNDGQTPLHYAASCEHISIVQLLVQAGADVNIQDFDGSKPIDTTNNADILAILNKNS
ncbi:acyl-CoA-binding domain-containing protein 6 [Lingula anatina]|uniref:Acyl-CoA-binding domain-containing protein 6 n=1 Tax=Lingula anatina TaxID=7574 RepID=A0A1S3JIA3_LINAN|nr:acyl-CoA-binding domain-containing protein 6 [Lingula anatina]|eukprot:XP_013410093.1 acyl-CoA-binding domain-containing protein 6 [Lingula anatina]